MPQLTVDPEQQDKATTAVLVRMTDRQKQQLAAYAERHGLNYGAACRRLIAQALRDGATT